MVKKIAEPAATPNAAAECSEATGLPWTRTNRQAHPPDLAVRASLPWDFAFAAGRRRCLSHMSGNATYQALKAHVR
jgi:hypothetical protein